MKINERYRKCPIKFYKNPDGTIYYEAPFINGTAENMDKAFKVFSDTDWEYDLMYYYNDVLDVKFGSFEPAIRDLKKHGRTYIGKINLELDINPDFKDEHTVQHLASNPQDIPKHQRFVKDLKDKRKRQEFINKLKSGVKKLAGRFTEMFDPVKTREDLICSHCGEIIPKGTYYEEYQNGCYHLECIWDKLYGEKSKSYEDCREYFFSLQQYIGNWPSDLDIEDDYLIDLEFVKSNDRRLGLHEEAAMYKSNQPTFKDFYEYVIKNPKCKRCYFQFTNNTIRVPSDTILHDYRKHNTTYEEWIDCISNIEHITNASISKKKLGSSNADVAIIHVIGKTDYGVSVQLENGYSQIMTLFVDNSNKIDNWVKTSSAGGLSNKPIASLGTGPISVVQPRQNSDNIIQYIKEKIKP